MIDTSGSMETLGRMQTAIKATITVLKTLVVTDFVGVVKFSSSATQLCGSGIACGSLARATSANVKALITMVSALTENGSTNIEDGMRVGLNLFTANAEMTSNCRRALLFLTDGIPTVGEQNAGALVALVKGFNAKPNAVQKGSLLSIPEVIPAAHP